MRIAVFDYRIIPTNPIGGCHHKLIAGLCHQHEFTVFSVDFENPCPQRVRWVRIPLPIRPYILLYLAFHVVAPIVYAWHYLFRGARFDLIQMVEANLSFGDVSYSQFCHRRFLQRFWKDSKATGLRGVFRSIAHRAVALMEPFVYKRVRRVVVPSRGLQTELRECYPAEGSKITVVPNPVDTESLRPPDTAERQRLRESFGYSSNDLVLVFAALGHFERKGLPLVLAAMSELADPKIHLLVIGGLSDVVAEYTERATKLGLADHVRFEGLKRDLRPYFWCADAFVFPSCYETFSLVTFEAAAAGLPVVVTQLHGVEDMLRDARNGFLVDRTVSGVLEGLGKLRALTPEQRRTMGAEARQATQGYDREHFVAAWKAVYETEQAAVAASRSQESQSVIPLNGV